MTIIKRKILILKLVLFFLPALVFGFKFDWINEEPAKVKNHQIVEHTGYKLSFNKEYKVADWVAYELTNEEVNASGAQRKENFRADPYVIGGSATLEDYRNSGYSRGHLAPAADFKWSDQAMSDTFYMSNMTPQLQTNFRFFSEKCGMRDKY